MTAADVVHAEALWLGLLRSQVLALTEVSLVGRYWVTAEQGKRLQRLMYRCPLARTTTDALAREGCSLGEWLAS